MDFIDREYFLFNGKVLRAGQFDGNFIYYGTTVYEVIKIKNCVPVYLDDYLQRVEHSLTSVGKGKYFDRDQILHLLHKIIEINCVKGLSHLKIVFSFDNEYFGKREDIFALYFLKMPIPTSEQYNQGVPVITIKAKRENPNVKIFLPDLRKRAEQLIEQHKIYEVILVDEHNIVTEGSRSNVFFVKNGQLFTAELHKVLPGITRKKVIEISRRNGLPVNETIIYYDKLKQFEAAFLTGTSRKIVPIKRIDNIEFDVQNMQMRQLMQWYDAEIENYVASHRAKWQCSEC